MLFRSGPTDDLAIAACQCIKYFKIPVTLRSVRKRVESHPDHPSIKCITDTFDHYKIKNYPLRITQEELDQLDAPFIAHTHQNQGTVLFVASVTTRGMRVAGTSVKTRLISKDEFLKAFSGVVILVEPTPESGELQFKNKRQTQTLNTILIPSMAFVVLAISIILSPPGFRLWADESPLLITKLLGLTISALLVINELKPGNTITDKLCHTGKHTNCDSVTNYPAATVYGWIKWSDLGCIYFLAGCLMALGGNPYTDILQLIAVVALPYVFYSLYQQAFVIKAWCPLCLGILMVLVIEFGLAMLKGFSFEQKLVPWLQMALGYSLTALVYLLAKHSIMQDRIFEHQTIRYQKLKRNPVVFQSLLQQGRQINTLIDTGSLLFGNKQPNTPRLTAFLSLQCHHCAATFRALEEMMVSGNICVHIVPVMTQKDAKQREFLIDLSEARENKEDRTALELITSWYNQEYQVSRTKQRRAHPEAISFIQKNVQLTIQNHITEFPSVFVQGYRLTDHYEISEIAGFASVLTEMTSAGKPNEITINA